MKRKTKKIKMDKFDMFVLMGFMFTMGMLVQKIAICGIGCLTTIYK